MLETRLSNEGYDIIIGYEYHCENSYWGSGNSIEGIGGSSVGPIGGGGATGGGGAIGGGNSGETSTSVVDTLYADNSTLTPEQKEKLDEALQDFINDCPQYKKMFEYLAKNVKIVFEINPVLEKWEAPAGYFAQVLMFYNEDCIQFKFLREELIHAVQEVEFYGMDGMLSARKNVEFEAKVIQDIVALTITGAGAGMAFMGETGEIQMQYINWLVNDLNDMDVFISKFNSFCERWKNYGGSYKSDFTPRVIEEYFNKNE